MQQVLKLTSAAAVVSLLLALAPTAGAAGWQVDGSASRINFVSVKNDAVGETHAFTRVDGSVDASGAARLEIALDSVDTGIDIRNERMRSMLFETAKYAAASITTTVPVADLEELGAGEHLMVPVTLTLALHGITAELPGELSVTGLADGGLLVTTARPLIVDAARFDLGAGVEALRTVAKLASIDTAVPITAQLVMKPAVP